MSLRIYIKGTPKFSSPKRTTQALPFSPNFNSLYTSKLSNPNKERSYQPADSKDPSVMHETNTLSMDNPSPSFDEHSTSNQLIKRKVTEQNTGRYLNNKTEEQQTDRFLKNDRELRSQKEIQEAIRDFNVKLNHRANVPEKQLRKIIQESDNMILSLLEEVEQLTEMFNEKIKDNDMLKSFTTIPTSTQDYRFRPGTAEDGRTEIEVFKRNESLLENGEVSRLMQENKKMAEEISKLVEQNSELNEEVSLLREMGSSSDKTLQKERENYIKLKAQAEELLVVYDEMAARTKEKDQEIRRLEEELLDAKVCAEKLRRAEAGRTAIVDDSKRNILTELQSPHDNLEILKVRDEMNHTLSPFSKGVSPTMWSHFKIESPLCFQVDKPKEDIKELQKRYEETKNDNAKLMKIIEGNQKVIKDLKDAFTELEKRNSVRFEEIKDFYESRVEGALQESNINLPKSSNRTDLNNDSGTKATSGILNSFISSSRGIHSKKPSSESAPRSKRSLIPMAI